MVSIRKAIVGALMALMVCSTSYAQYASSILYNRSGGTVSKYDIVIWDTSNDRSFKTTTTSRDGRVIGTVVDNSILNNNTGAIATGSSVVTVRVTGAVTRGDYLVTSTTAGAAASGGTTNTSGAFALALESGTNTNIKAYTFTPDQITSGDITIAGDLAVNGGDITTTASTFNLLNTTATTVNFAGAATTLNIGNASGATAFSGTVDFAGNIALGSNGAVTTGQPITVDHRPTDTSGTKYYNNQQYLMTPGGADSAFQYGERVYTYLNAAQTHSGQIGAALYEADSGTASGTVSSLAAFIGRISNRNSGTVTNAYSVLADNFVSTGGTNNIPTWYGVNIAANTNATAAAIGSTSKYGLYVGNISGAATNNYALYTNNGTVRFGGNVTCDSGTILSSQTTMNVFNTVSTTVNFAGAATTLSMGAGAASTATLSFTSGINLNTGTIASNQTTVALLNSGVTTVNFAGGASAALNIGNASATATFAGGITIADAKNIVFNTTTGTKIGTATTQKLSFYNSTPVVQPSTTGETTGFTAGGGTNVTDSSTFTGNVGSTAYRISDIVKHLKNLGLIAN